MSQFEEIPSPGYGFQGSRVRKSRALAACTGKTLGMPSVLTALARGISQTREPWKPQPGDGISSNWLIAELLVCLSC